MLVIGITGTTLNAAERDWLLHPSVGGVILFTRNFESREQVTELVAAIRAASKRPQLLCVDQEGGRVQRFRAGFAALPPLECFDAMHAHDAGAALALAEEHAWLMASEIRALDVDLSFAPVADLGRGNRAIGDRAFSPDPAIVAEFARAYVRGMHAAGMAATLKHFPGHGSVLEDTHHDAASDSRSLDTIRSEDIVPFAAGIAAGAEAVMLAHVAYPMVAPEPAGYSPRWIGEILRRDMGFRGVVFSDDIGMAAAESAGGIAARIGAHLEAGCDAVLVCSPELVADSLAAMDARLARGLVPDALAAMDARPTPRADTLASLFGRGRLDWDALHADPRHALAVARVTGNTVA